MQPTEASSSSRRDGGNVVGRLEGYTGAIIAGVDVDEDVKRAGQARRGSGVLAEHPEPHLRKLIGEVSELCDVKPHVLRYWETEFPSLSPVKRRGNRRYYQRHDVLMVRQIRGLLYEQGYTIGGARLRLEGEGAKQESALSSQIVRQVRMELEEVLQLLRR